jgi:hypothetical protein
MTNPITCILGSLYFYLHLAMQVKILRCDASMRIYF